jgi:hypothetical protein
MRITRAIWKNGPVSKVLFYAKNKRPFAVPHNSFSASLVAGCEVVCFYQQCKDATIRMDRVLSAQQEGKQRLTVTDLSTHWRSDHILFHICNLFYVTAWISYSSEPQ